MPDSFDFWANTDINVETARATALVITGITKANPAVVAFTAGVDPTIGQTVVFLNVAGMTQLNNSVHRVGTVVAGVSFQIEDCDSTLYGTFISGTCATVTLGVAMTTVQSVNSSGGEPNFADLSTIHTDIQVRAPVTFSPHSMTLECLFKPEDAAHIALGAASRAKSAKVVEVEWSSERRMFQLFYVGSTGIPTGSAGEAVKQNVSFEGQGFPTFYGD